MGKNGPSLVPSQGNSRAVARAGGAGNAAQHAAHEAARSSHFLPVSNARMADSARRNPAIPGALPGCRPVSRPAAVGFSAELPMPQTKMRSMQIRHELRQALGPTFSHMAEAQLIKTLTALAAAPSSDTTAGDVGEARAAGKVTLEKMKAAFGPWGVSDSSHPGLLLRFWGTLSEMVGGASELDVRFVSEEVRTVLSLSARARKVDSKSAMKHWVPGAHAVKLMDGPPVRRTVSAWSTLQLHAQPAELSDRSGATALPGNTSRERPQSRSEVGAVTGGEGGVTWSRGCKGRELGAGGARMVSLVRWMRP